MWLCWSSEYKKCCNLLTTSEGLKIQNTIMMCKVLRTMKIPTDPRNNFCWYLWVPPKLQTKYKNEAKNFERPSNIMQWKLRATLFSQPSGPKHKQTCASHYLNASSLPGLQNKFSRPPGDAKRIKYRYTYKWELRGSHRPIGPTWSHMYMCIQHIYM